MENWTQLNVEGQREIQALGGTVVHIDLYSGKDSSVQKVSFL